MGACVNKRGTALARSRQVRTSPHVDAFARSFSPALFIFSFLFRNYSGTE